MKSSSQNIHFTFRTAAQALCAASAMAFAVIPAMASSITVHTASAYGAKVTVGSTVKLGPIAPVMLPACSTQPIATYTASAAGISDAPVLGTGAVSTSASSTATTSTGSSEVLGVSLLGGIVSASELKAVSNTSATSGVFSFSTAGSVFSGLSVLGIPITVSPAPNTTIDLPGIGSVVLNEQTTSTSGDKSELTVIMVDIHVTLPNTLGIAAGTRIVVAEASSEIKVTSGVAVVGGYAQAIQLVAGVLSSGPVVYEALPCYGTYGATDTDSVASAGIPGIVSTGTIAASVEGLVQTGATNSTAITSVQNLNLISNLVGATGIKSTATGTTSDGVTFDFTGGTTFASISVAGHPEITVNVAPNTKIEIAGLGKLYINRVQTYADKIKVTSVELVIDSTNSLGLPIGADLTIGVAEAQLHSATTP